MFVATCTRPTSCMTSSTNNDKLSCMQHILIRRKVYKMSLQKFVSVLKCETERWFVKIRTVIKCSSIAQFRIFGAVSDQYMGYARIIKFCIKFWEGRLIS
jgi:hypothetical protein